MTMKGLSRPSQACATHVRALFLSDVHLGTRHCQAELLLDFLQTYQTGHIYLVGDIIDAWQLRIRWHWPKAHDEVVRCLLAKMHGGTRITYVPGNHDEFLRRILGSTLGGVEILDMAMHLGADGRRHLVVHGDRFDLVTVHARWLALLGDRAYEAALVVNTHLNRMRRRMGLRYWSVSAWAKLRVKQITNYISRFERHLAGEAERLNVEGIICGHIHHAEIREEAGVQYVNTGDWVESCTAVVERLDGHFEILRWAELSMARSLLNAKSVAPYQASQVASFDETLGFRREQIPIQHAVVPDL